MYLVSCGLAVVASRESVLRELLSPLSVLSFLSDAPSVVAVVSASFHLVPLPSDVARVGGVPTLLFTG